MGLAVQQGEDAAERDARSDRERQLHGDRQAENRHGGRNSDLDPRHREAAEPEERSREHHGDEGRGPGPEGASADKPGPDADRRYREEVVEAQERMQEAVLETVHRACARMGESGRRSEKEEGRRRENAHGRHPCCV
jgi:hypothetical protein